VGPASGVIDQAASHGSSCYSEKMTAILPVAILGGDKANIDFIDQVGGVERMIAPFAGHVGFGHAAQVRQDQLKELLLRGAITRTPAAQQVCNLSGFDRHYVRWAFYHRDDIADQAD